MASKVKKVGKQSLIKKIEEDILKTTSASNLTEGAVICLARTMVSKKRFSEAAALLQEYIKAHGISPQLEELLNLSRMK